MDIWDIVWVAVRLLLAVYLVLGFFYYLKAQSESAKETVDGRPRVAGIWAAHPFAHGSAKQAFQPD